MPTKYCMITLPDKIFLTGAPGSHWSAIAQDVEQIPGFNTSDRIEGRSYDIKSFKGHKGAYFGRGMEYDSDIENFAPECLVRHLGSPWATKGGTKLLKSHDWPYRFDVIEKTFPNDWIMLVYRPDMASYAWWHEAGGFNITYPSYSAYKDSAGMLCEITKQNQKILVFAHKRNATWSHYSSEWIEKELGAKVEVSLQKSDILVTLIK